MCNCKGIIQIFAIMLIAVIIVIVLYFAGLILYVLGAQVTHTVLVSLEQTDQIGGVAALMSSMPGDFSCMETIGGSFAANSGQYLTEANSPQKIGDLIRDMDLGAYIVTMLDDEGEVVTGFGEVPVELGKRVEPDWKELMFPLPGAGKGKEKGVVASANMLFIR